LKGYRSIFDPALLLSKKEDLYLLTLDPLQYNSPEYIQATQELNKVDILLSSLNSISILIKDIQYFLEFEDPELYLDIDQLNIELAFQVQNLKNTLLFEESYSKNNCYLTIKSGAGGLEAEDWTMFLFRMYVKFCESKNWMVDVSSVSYGDQGGIKEVTLYIQGKYAYGWLNGEKGNHRLTRISPYDSKDRRHTSFAGVSLLPEIKASSSIEINKSDLEFDYYFSSGPGGQHANKNATAVRARHLPSGHVASCQIYKSQKQNKKKVIEMIRSLLEIDQEELRVSQEEDLVGDKQQIGFGSRIRSYSYAPTKYVKDHRTDYETTQLDSVLSGDLESILESYLLSKL